jgi:hypothetical protein
MGWGGQTIPNFFQEKHLDWQEKSCEILAKSLIQARPQGRIKLLKRALSAP